jgi:hypothetical protein
VLKLVASFLPSPSHYSPECTSHIKQAVIYTELIRTGSVAPLNLCVTACTGHLFRSCEIPIGSVLLRNSAYLYTVRRIRDLGQEALHPESVKPTRSHILGNWSHDPHRIVGSNGSHRTYQPRQDSLGHSGGSRIRSCSDENARRRM